MSVKGKIWSKQAAMDHGEASQAQFQWLQQCYAQLQSVVAELEVIAQQSAVHKM